MIGERYHNLLIIGDAGRDKKSNKLAVCQCDCGNVSVKPLFRLKNGGVISCGCLMGWNFKTHGLSKHPLHAVWKGIKSRCHNPNRKSYRNYGGRGIKICDQWFNDFKSFYHWGLSNGWRNGLVLDRIDNDGNYEPSNCRFVTRKINANNTRSNIKFDYEGIRYESLQELATAANVNYGTLYGRIFKYKWTLEKAIITPVRKLTKRQT